MPGAAHGTRLPVEGVSWWAAVQYCNALSERTGLTPAYHGRGDDIVRTPPPTGTGCSPRGRMGARLPWGTTGPRYGPRDEVAWHRGNSDEQIHEVDRKQPNTWGLHDTLGNVWEWCWDLYDPEVYGTCRVLRGGGWFDEHWSCRASVRRRSHPTLRIDDVGFRIVRG